MYRRAIDHRIAQSLLRAVMFTAVAVCVFCAGAQAALPPKFGGAANLRLTRKITTLNPAMATSPDAFSLILAIYEPLIRPSENGFKPVLLQEAPDVSNDGLTYYFKLKKDVKFHDGSPLRPQDVLHSMELLAASKGSHYAWIYDGIKGVDDLRSGKADTLAGVRIVDEQRFEVILAKKDADFLKYLCLPAAAVAPEHIEKFRNPVGTGPFKFKSMKDSGDVELAAFDDYHNGRPYLDTLNFRVIPGDEDAVLEFKAGRLSAVNVPLNGGDAALGDPVRGNMRCLWFLDLNTARKPFATRAARLGVSRALDRSGLVNGVLNGRGRVENNFVNKGKTSTPGYDNPLTLRYEASGKAADVIAEKLRQDLAKIGLKIKLEPVPGHELLRFKSRTAPDLLLRVLPVAMNLAGAVDRALFDTEPVTYQSALGLRVQSKDAREQASSHDLAVFLFSHKTEYALAKQLAGARVGPFNQLDLQNATVNSR